MAARFLDSSIRLFLEGEGTDEWTAKHGARLKVNKSLSAKPLEPSLLTLRTWLLLTVLTVLVPLGVALLWLSQHASKSLPVQAAEAANEARLRRINESWLRLLLKTTQRMGPLLHEVNKPDRDTLDQLLTHCPSVLTLDWYSKELDCHVRRTRPQGTPIGTPIVLLTSGGKDPAVRISAVFEQEALHKVLLDKLPPDNEAVAALIDPEGLLLVRSPAEATLGKLPTLTYPQNANWLRQTGPLQWEKLRLLWLRDLHVGIVVKRPVVRAGDLQTGMLLLYKGLAGMLVITTLLSVWLTRPVRQLQDRLVTATGELVADADWSQVDPSDELEVIEIAFATLAERTQTPKETVPTQLVNNSGGITPPGHD